MNRKALTLCSGLKSRSAGVKAKTDPLSYGREREKCVRERERERERERGKRYRY